MITCHTHVTHMSHYVKALPLLGLGAWGVLLHSRDARLGLQVSANPQG